MVRKIVVLRLDVAGPGGKHPLQYYTLRFKEWKTAQDARSFIVAEYKKKADEVGEMITYTDDFGDSIAFVAGRLIGADLHEFEEEQQSYRDDGIGVDQW